MTVQLKITGMNCQHCVGAVTRALESVPGVERAQVDLESGIARVAGEADASDLVRAVTEAGYSAEPAD